MSISALNEHLATLEDLGLIHRIRAHDPHSHRRLPTRYVLGFEQGFPQKPTPESEDGFVEIMQENDDIIAFSRLIASSPDEVFSV